MIGCLLIHGFTGAPYEIEPLAQHLRETTEWIIKTPTLPGHGETIALKGVSNSEWVNFAENELLQLMEDCEQVFLIGFSMGGIIAGYLAAKYPIKVKKLVLLSAAAYYINPKQLLVDIKDMVKDGVKGHLEENELFLRYRNKITDTPLSATIEFRKLVKQIRPQLTNIYTPTLIIQGECDGIVPIKSAYYLYEKISSEQKQLKFLPSSKHHVCYGPDCDELVKIVDFFLHN